MWRKKISKGIAISLVKLDVFSPFSVLGRLQKSPMLPIRMRNRYSDIANDKQTFRKAPHILPRLGARKTHRFCFWNGTLRGRGYKGQASPDIAPMTRRKSSAKIQWYNKIMTSRTFKSILVSDLDLGNAQFHLFFSVVWTLPGISYKGIVCERS